MSILSLNKNNNNYNYPLSYKEINKFDFRKSESTNILTKYPERIPVIVEKTKQRI